MIDYDVLCQTIEDWRAGRRPSAPIPGPTPAAPAAGYEQVDSGLVMMDGEEEQAYEGGDGYEAESGQYEQGYAEGQEGYPAESGQYEQGYAEQAGQYEGGFAEQSYGEPISATEGYDEHGAPEPVERTGTPQVYAGEEPPPYAADEPAPYTEMIPTDEAQAEEVEEVEGDEEEFEVDADDEEEPVG